MTEELYKKHRPSTLDELVGQDEVADMLESMIENKRIPHCILASGPSGTGKTTTLRILRDAIECSGIDFVEINAADYRGIDMVRDLRSGIGLSPIQGKTKAWLIDEAHQLTAQAQESLLKILEDTPKHVYFFLASTDPQKLKRTIITRCTHLVFRNLMLDELKVLVTSVYKKETKEKLADSIASKVAELAEGSARKALVLLHQIMHLDMSDEDNVVEHLQSSQVERDAIEICRALLNPKTDWSTLSTILKEVTEDPESIRWMILGYMSNVALGGGKMSTRACSIIDEFRDNFFDSKKAGLVASCFNSVNRS